MSNFEAFINSSEIPIISSNGIHDQLIGNMIKSNKFNHFIQTISPEFDTRNIDVQSIDMFGPNLGFAKFKADVRFNGKAAPGIVMMRGPSVAILVVLSCEGAKYILCTKQPRFPIGVHDFIEIPAGMVDEETGNFMGVAAKELEEETGIKINFGTDRLINLGVMYPSPGLCDEYIILYAFELEINREKFNEIQNKSTGNIEEGEQITLCIIDYNEAHMLSDSKALCAMIRYERLFK